KASGPAAAFGLPRASRSLDVLLEKKRHLREGADGRLVVELAAVELARLPSARDLDALIEALRAEGSARATAASPPLARATPLSRPSSGPSRVAESVEAFRAASVEALGCAMRLVVGEAAPAPAGRPAPAPAAFAAPPREHGGTGIDAV